MVNKVLIGSFLTLCAYASTASEVSDAKVTRLMIDDVYGQKLYIQIDTNVSRTNCHNNSAWQYVLDTGNEVGKNIHAQLLTALTAAKNVRIIGKDTCLVHSEIETLRRLEIY